MNSIADDLILLISTFIDDRSNYCLSQVSKNTYRILKKGYVRHLSFDYLKDNVTTFTERFYDHHRSIRSCSMTFLHNAFLWLPKWVETVYLFNCYIDHAIDPSEQVITRKLWIKKEGDDIVPLHINWNKFPYLEEIHIKNYDVNYVDALERCKMLKKIICI